MTPADTMRAAVEALELLIQRAECLYGVVYYAEPWTHKTQSDFVKARSALSLLRSALEGGEPHPCRWFNGKCIDCGRSWGAPRDGAPVVDHGCITTAVVGHETQNLTDNTASYGPSVARIKGVCLMGSEGEPSCIKGTEGCKVEHTVQRFAPGLASIPPNTPVEAGKVGVASGVAGTEGAKHG